MTFESSVILMSLIIMTLKNNVSCDNIIRIPIYQLSSYTSSAQNDTEIVHNKSSRLLDEILPEVDDIYTKLSSIADAYLVGRIFIGTPAQEFFIGFDTRSSDLWVPSVNCSANCENFNKYDAKLSSTYVDNGKTFSIEYGDGSSVTGVLSIDTVSINGIELKNQTFAECTSIIGMNDSLNDGILGLAYPSLTFDNETSFLHNIWNRGLISKPIFSFYLNPDTNSSSTSELIFGDIDSSKYIGSITYVPLIVQTTWEFRLESIYVDTTVINSSSYAILDTISVFVIGPTTSVNDLNIALGGIYDTSVAMYTVDCMRRSLSSFPNVIFLIGGENFTLTPSQYILALKDEVNNYICYTIFVPSNMYDPRGNPLWLLGNFFLQRFYSIFDVLNNRVGLATSISYNWTQPFDSSLFPIETTIALNLTTTVSINATSSNSIVTTTLGSKAINSRIYFSDSVKGIVLLLTTFLMKIL